VGAERPTYILMRGTTGLSLMDVMVVTNCPRRLRRKLFCAVAASPKTFPPTEDVGLGAKFAIFKCRG
jgi:hypothetical protein